MEKRLQVFVTFVFLVILIAGLYFFTNWFSLITGYFTGESGQQTIASCLKEQGTEFYFSIYCAECEKQDKELGRYSQTLTRIDCGNQKENCLNIREVPAWYIPKSPEKINYGFKTIDELKALGKCK